VTKFEADRLIMKGRTEVTANHYFIVAGISLRSIQKELKPALPKRRQKESYLVVIRSDTNSVKIAVARGAVTLPT
jgi:hypothetical protein